MPFQKITAEKLSAAITRQIETLILRGILRAGDRLPAERELSLQLGVSRPSLRAAIADLEKRQLLVTKPNAGVFVADVLGSAFAPPLIALFAAHDEALFDYLTFRTDLEGLAAERAATQASDTDLRVIQTIFDKMQSAPDAETEAAFDAEFHLAIIEASHNVIMLHMMRSMFQLLKTGVFYNRQIMFRQQTTRKALLNQHRAINDALQNRNPKAAKSAVQAHLEFVRVALHQDRQTSANETVAKMRLRRESED